MVHVNFDYQDRGSGMYNRNILHQDARAIKVEGLGLRQPHLYAILSSCITGVSNDVEIMIVWIDDAFVSRFL